MKKKTLIIFYTVFMPLNLQFGSVCGAVIGKANEPAPKIMFAHVDVTERVITLRDKVFAIPAKMPILPGHVLVCPRRCVLTMDELEKDEQDEIHRLVADVKVALRKAFGAEGFNVAWNDGKVSGQSMPHLHVHVLPRTTGDKGIVEYEPRSFLYRPEWYREGCIEIRPNEELLLIAQKVAKHLPKRSNS